MLNLMEQFPLGEYGFHSTKALHVMIEAKKLAYADMLRYVARSALLRTCRWQPMLEQGRAKERARADRSGEGRVRRRAVDVRRPDRRRAAATRSICPSSTSDGNIVSLIQSIYSAFGSGARAAGHRLHAAQPRRAVHARETATRTRSRRASGRCTRSSRRSWRRATCRSASASWAASTRRRRTRSSSPNIVDYGLDIQQALEAGRFTKATFDGLRRRDRSARARERRATS